jgi:hypothetical protein
MQDMESTLEADVSKAKNPSPFRDQPAPLPQASRFPIATIVGVLYAFASAVLIAILPEPRNERPIDYIVIAILFGSLFGHTTSASIWSSLGTGYHWLRTLLSLGWLFLLVIGLTAMMTRSRSPDNEMVLVVSGTMLLQSLFIQIPLWILRYRMGLRLSSGSELATDGTERVQFGIVHMMFFTVIIALVLGAAQALIRFLGPDNTGPSDEWSIFLYLAAAAILVSLPVAVAMLLTRHQIVALVLAGVFVFLVTGMEYPLMLALGLQRGGPDIYHVVSINLSVAMAVLTYSAGLRLFGFRLTWGHADPFAKVKA